MLKARSKSFFTNTFKPRSVKKRKKRLIKSRFFKCLLSRVKKKREMDHKEGTETFYMSSKTSKNQKLSMKRVNHTFVVVVVVNSIEMCP